MKKNQGITLIALVITIIVLLILAGVSIATLLGENGILSQAQRAKEETKTATVEEQRKLAIGEAITNLGETEYQGITIPAGMAPTRIEGESTVEEGLVAIDKNGNEWVWIEVLESAMPEDKLTFADEKDYDTLTEALKTYATDYTKGTIDSDYSYKDIYYDGCGIEAKGEKNAQEVYKEMYQTMLRSVYKNGGFWIGRYEAGIEGSTGTDEASLNKARLSHANIDTTSPKAICQRDAIPYNFVTCSEAQKLASQMTPDETKTSSLMFGIQWNLVCKYLENKDSLKQEDINSDSGKWGNYKNQTVEINSKKAKQYSDKWSTITEIKPVNQPILLSTGASNKTKKLNIYDFAGNDHEWTLEKAIESGSKPYAPCTCVRRMLLRYEH